MTLDSIRQICRALPGVTEDIKWGADLAFSVGGKMFCVVNVDPPHQISFKCTPEGFADLVERPGLIPAPYLARANWVQESALGEALERPELDRLLRTSYELVRAKLPRKMRDALEGRRVDRPHRFRKDKRAQNTSRRRGNGAERRGPASLRSLKVSEGFKAFVLDQLSELGEVVLKAMCGITRCRWMCWRVRSTSRAGPAARLPRPSENAPEPIVRSRLPRTRAVA